MRKAILPIVALVGFIMMLPFFASTSAFAQDRPFSEKYMQQHDGGDRAEYLEEMDHSDPWFYVPPVKDARISTTTNDNVTAN